MYLNSLYTLSSKSILLENPALNLQQMFQGTEDISLKILFRINSSESVFIAIGVLSATAVGVIHTLYMLLFAEVLVVRKGLA